MDLPNILEGKGDSGEERRGGIQRGVGDHGCNASQPI